MPYLSRPMYRHPRHNGAGGAPRLTAGTLARIRSAVVFRDLARRLGCEGAFAEGRDETAWLRHLYDAFRDRAQSNLVPEFGTF